MADKENGSLGEEDQPNDDNRFEVEVIGPFYAKAVQDKETKTVIAANLLLDGGKHEEAVKPYDQNDAKEQSER